VVRGGAVVAHPLIVATSMTLASLSSAGRNLTSDPKDFTILRAPAAND
jgi:hypothetical protein